MAAELIAIGFNRKHRAAEVLNELESVRASWAIDLKDAIAAYRSNDGWLHVDKSFEPTTREGAAWAAIIGGLIGAMVLSPITASSTVPASIAAIRIRLGLTGLTGAVFSADDAEYWKQVTGISDEFVEKVYRMVRPGQSAVFVLVRASDPAKVEEHFRSYGGRVLRTTPARDAAAKFRESINNLARAAA